MSTTPSPAHLLFFDKPLAHDLVDGRFGDCRGDGFFIAVAVAIIGNGGSVGTNVVVKLVQCSGQLLSLTACLGIDIPFEVFQYLQCLVDVAMPEEPFHPLQFLLELLSFVLGSILAHEGGTYCCTSSLRKNAPCERDHPLLSSEPLFTLRSKVHIARSSSKSKGVAYAVKRPPSN